MCPMCSCLQSKLLDEHVVSQDLSLLVLWQQMRAAKWKSKYNSSRYIHLTVLCWQLVIIFPCLNLILSAAFWLLLHVNCRMPLRSSLSKSISECGLVWFGVMGLSNYSSCYFRGLDWGSCTTRKNFSVDLYWSFISIELPSSQL